MAENKTKPTKVSVASYIAALPREERRADAKALVKLMERVSGARATMWGPSIIGFGRYHYVYASGREGDAPLLAFAPRDPATVLYFKTDFEGGPELVSRLGKFKRSGGCLHVKRLSDLDPAVLESLARKSLAARLKEYPPSKAR